jgi:methyl-accepting chemotaxis protein
MKAGSNAGRGVFNLRRKLIAAVVVLTLIITLLVLAVELWSVRGTLARQTHSQGSALADTIATTAGYHVTFDRRDDLRSIIADLSRRDEIEYADFITAGGDPLAASDGPIPASLAAIRLAPHPQNDRASDAGQNLHLFLRPFFAVTTGEELGEADSGERAAAPQGYFRLAINERNVIRATRSLLLGAIPITLLALLVGVALAAWGSRFIVRPILDVVDSATSIAAGDLTRRTSIDTGDELGSLSRAFNGMSVNLGRTVSQLVQSQGKIKSVVETVGSRSSIVIQSVDEQKKMLDEAYNSLGQLDSGVRKISDNVESLSAASEETSSSILQMVASMEEVSRHTDSLFTSVEQTATATAQMAASIADVDKNVGYLQNFVTDTSASMTQMSASINQVESNAARSYDLSMATAEAAESGMRAVRETIEGMEQVRTAVYDANQVVSRLGERSAEIGKILNVIDDIAEQTNLLALNAAILAATAGEHGKGFSVVAAEIRELSERTATSTRDIANLIRSVQGEVSNASRSMSDGSSMVERGVELSHEAGRELTRILEAANKSSEMGKEIAGATREQAKGSEAVAGSIERLQDLVRQINSATGQQSSGSAHIMKAVESMREVTRYVRQAMDEQKSGSGMISKAAERMIDMVHEIFEITAGQASESEKIVATMKRVREIADGNRRSAAEMSQAIGLLGEAVRGLDDEVRKFKVRG